MTNMSYCRFHNTVNDLLDCEEHTDDRNLSEEENKYRIRLIKICKRITEDFDGSDIDALFEDNKEED
jgi:hypothetical protein